MRAVVFDSFGAPSVLPVASLPDPVPGFCGRRVTLGADRIVPVRGSMMSYPPARRRRTMAS
jgi:hypothetical protein